MPCIICVAAHQQPNSGFMPKTMALPTERRHSAVSKAVLCCHIKFCETCLELNSQSLGVFHLSGHISLSWETGAKGPSTLRPPAQFPCPQTLPLLSCCTGPLKGLFQYCVEARLQVNGSPRFRAAVWVGTNGLFGEHREVAFVCPSNPR